MKCPQPPCPGYPQQGFRSPCLSSTWSRPFQKAPVQNRSQDIQKKGAGCGCGNGLGQERRDVMRRPGQGTEGGQRLLSSWNTLIFGLLTHWAAPESPLAAANQLKQSKLTHHSFHTGHHAHPPNICWLALIPRLDPYLWDGTAESRKNKINHVLYK